MTQPITYTVSINGTSTGAIVFADEPFYEGPGARYPIRRVRHDRGSWGVDYDYAVHCPDGRIARGAASHHDGFGVTLPGESWGFRSLEEGVHLLGGQVKIAVDRAARKVTIDSPHDERALPYILCGVVMLIDPN